MGNILIIDDDIQIRKLLRDILTQAGHVVVEAKDGKEGMKVYRQSPTDLVLTDILMPEKEGFETIRDLCREFPNVRIIAISGGSVRLPLNILDVAKKLGARRTIMKPFAIQTVLEAVMAELQHSSYDPLDLQQTSLPE